MRSPIERAWDAEYTAGRYEDDMPVAFVDDVVEASHECGLVGGDGLYIGCGNGRNYAPLVSAGLDLVGLDVSGTAIQRLAERMPDRRHRLVHGDLSGLPREAKYPLVIGIQVFQHGHRGEAHAHIRVAQDRVAERGLFCIRVNAVGTDIEYAHEFVEDDDDGGFTIRYLEGPKAGLLIHFFAEQELHALFSGWEEFLPLRRQRTWREPRHRGSWLQWEAIWRR